MKRILSYTIKAFLICSLLFSMSILPSDAKSHMRSLTRTEAENALKEMVAKWSEQQRTRLDYMTTSHTVTSDSFSMPVHWQVFGEEPADGRSLFISLHGGGKVEKKTNDDQWRNQWRLYSLKEGVYLCPRAAVDDWDMHCKPFTDKLYQDIILYGMTHLNVNPDKVYLLGYSAGGDGVWRLAPRMADTWAAASMMAGHPGNVGLLNLRNLPFMVWCGENDGAYNRNVLNATRILQLDSLQKQDSGGYVHYGEIVKGKPHWMDRKDTLAVQWMAQFKRNPYPFKIVWRQEEVLKNHIYWLSVLPEETRTGMELRVSREGNRIVIEKCDYSHLIIHLNDAMVNLDLPVQIVYGGKVIYHKRPKRAKSTIEKNLYLRNDPRYAFCCDIPLKF